MISGAGGVPANWRTGEFGILIGDSYCVYTPISNPAYLQSPDWLPVSGTAHLRRGVAACIVELIQQQLVFTS